MKKIILLILIFASALSFSQETELFITQDITVSSLIKGTLYQPKNTSNKTSLVILIAGSGPTNRSGNQFGNINNSLKFLAEELAKKNIAVYSYDKRIIAQMALGTVDEKSLRFDDFIEDAKSVIDYFKSQKKYSKVIIAGHSEGALIGMMAAKDKADAYISLAGAGRPIDEILLEQLTKQAPDLKTSMEEYFSLLKKGKTFELKNAALASIFRESVQPYMISWMKFIPQEEIKKLNIPVLIINGTKDIQVTVNDAQQLKKGKPEAQLKIIENMNHIFKEVKGDRNENVATYNNPKLPVMPELVNAISDFIYAL